MTALEIAKKIAKVFEGWSSKVYICPGGFATIGYGHRTAPDTPPINKTQGEAILESDMAISMRGVVKYCPILLKYPEKMGAIIDFAFNLGVGRLQASTLRRRINQENWPEAVKELRKWVRGGGRILPGLVARREAEARYLLTPQTVAGSPSSPWRGAS
jgi:lysozyme